MNSRSSSLLRTKSDAPRNQALRLRVRGMLRLAPRSARLLPMGEKNFNMWMCGAKWLDNKYINEMEIAIDWIFNQYLTKGIR